MITIEEARAYYSDQDSAHSFAHVLRVLRLAERIGKAEGADMVILRTAALLHDIAREEEDAGGACHAKVGASRVRQILAGRPQETIEAVAHAIRCHRFRGTCSPRTLEAKILYDADKLDAIGAIGVARAYAIAGRCAQSLWAKVPESYAVRKADEALEDVRSEGHTPVHEYSFKLSRLKDTLFTQTARDIAAGRQQYMAEFFRRLELEIRGDL